MKRNQIREKLQAAIELLLKNDRNLLEVDANERSITHKLAEWLAGEFEGWDVDCEYNRNQRAAKLLDLRIGGRHSTDTDARTVFPDIVVHHRGKEDNLLAIEAKKSSSTVPDNADLMKLKACIRQLGYVRAVFLRFVVGKKAGVGVRWVGEK